MVSHADSVPHVHYVKNPNVMNDVEVVKCSPATNMIAVARTETSSTIVQDCCLKGSKKNLRYLTEVTSLKK